MNNNRGIPKEVRRMSRLELMEILVEQGREIERLKAEKENLEKEVNRIRSQMRSVGTVDEAVDRLYEVITGKPGAAAAITPNKAKAAAGASAFSKPQTVRPLVQNNTSSYNNAGQGYASGRYTEDTNNGEYEDNYSDRYDNYDDGYDEQYDPTAEVDGMEPLDSWEEEGEFVEYI